MCVLCVLGGEGWGLVVVVGGGLSVGVGVGMLEGTRVVGR